MHKRWVGVLLILILLINLVPYPAAADELQLNGKAAILIDSRSGQVLYEKNSRMRMFPASTTKIMTALVALQHGKLTDIVTSGADAARTGGTSVYLKAGEQLSLEDMLYALLLNSANDAAVAIADHIAGSVPKFVALMNQEAEQIGARDTHFANPDGLPNANHYTTAYDMALIARKAMENQDFRRIVGTETKQINRADNNSLKLLQNHNKLLERYAGANGIKTGYTLEAGECIVASAERNGRSLIVVDFNSQGVDMWSDAESLLDYGFNQFQLAKLVSAGQVVGRQSVKHGAAPVTTVAAGDLYWTFPLNYTTEINVKAKLDSNITAPIKKNQKIGVLAVYDHQKYLGQVNLLAASAVPAAWWPVFKPYILVGVPILLFLWLALHIKKRKLRHRLFKRRSN